MQRERLIDAFVLVAAERGFEAAGVKPTCQRAGVAFNTFYEYFASKEDLFLAAFDAGVEVMFEHTSRVFGDTKGSWADKMQAAIGAFLETLANNPAFARYFAVESRKVGAQANSHVEVAFGRAYAMFVGVKPAFDLPMTDDELAQMVIGAIFAPIYWTIRSGSIEDLPRLGPKLTAFVLALFEDR